MHRVAAPRSALYTSRAAVHRVEHDERERARPVPVRGRRRDRLVVARLGASRRTVRRASSLAASSPVRSSGVDRQDLARPGAGLSTVSSRPSGTVADMQVSPNGSAVPKRRANAASWRSVVVDSGQSWISSMTQCAPLVTSAKSIG